VIRKPYTLKCPIVLGMWTKPSCIKQATFFNVPLDYFQNNSNSLPAVGKRLIGRKFLGKFWSLPGFGNFTTFSFSQNFGKRDSGRRSLNKCLWPTSCLLGMRHSFGTPLTIQSFLNFNEFTNLCMSQGLTFPKRMSSTAASRAWNPPVAHGFRYTGREKWTVFSKQSAIM
jgi:hypothetical protein